MVQAGVIAAQYLGGWRLEAEAAVLLAPAYTFLMANRPVEVQFWLDVGSRGWAERLYQPLTHPYVLSRAWQPGRLWTDADEMRGRAGRPRAVGDRVVAPLQELALPGADRLERAGLRAARPALAGLAASCIRNQQGLADE